MDVVAFVVVFVVCTGFCRCFCCFRRFFVNGDGEDDFCFLVVLMVMMIILLR